MIPWVDPPKFGAFFHVFRGFKNFKQQMYGHFEGGFPLKNYQCMKLGPGVRDNYPLGWTDSKREAVGFRYGGSQTRSGGGGGDGWTGPMGLVKNEQVVKELVREMMVHSLLLYLFRSVCHCKYCLRMMYQVTFNIRHYHDVPIDCRMLSENSNGTRMSFFKKPWPPSVSS